MVCRAREKKKRKEEEEEENGRVDLVEEIPSEVRPSESVSPDQDSPQIKLRIMCLQRAAPLGHQTKWNLQKKGVLGLAFCLQLAHY